MEVKFIRNGSSLRAYKLDAGIKLLTELIVEESDLEHKPEIVVFNKVCHQQLSTRFYSDSVEGYTYSHRTREASKLTTKQKALLEYVNGLLGSNYNSLLINSYKDGTEYISAHADDERNVDQHAGVASISHGASRKFRIRDKATREILADIPTNDTELWQMAGDFQKDFLHEVPQERKVTKRRTVITFRYFA